METFSTTQVCRIAGASYRELDYWSRVGCARPERDARGSGTHRRWTRRQAACVWVVARLRELGCPTATLRHVFADLDGGDPSLWEGPLVVEPGRQERPRPVRSSADLSAGWVVDPRPALDAVDAAGSRAAA